MRIIDCNNLEISHSLDSNYDFCIIGAGISGIIMADQLSNKFNIAIIESGDFSLNSKAQELNELIVSGYPIRENYQSRVRQYGGACNLWPGRSLILNDIDLQQRDWVDGSGWTISSDELNQYYSLLAEKYSMFDFSYFDNKSYDDFDDKMYKSIFEGSEFNSIKAGWSKKIARFGKKSKIFKQLVKNKNITLFKNATVEKLCDTGSNIDSCKIILNSKKSLNIKAKNFILATGGLENARILLSSTDQHKNGVGNENDNVGRYYMDHPSYVRRDVTLDKKIYNSSLFLKPLNNGRFKNGIRFDEDYQREHKLTNNYIEFSYTQFL